MTGDIPPFVASAPDVDDSDEPRTPASEVDRDPADDGADDVSEAGSPVAEERGASVVVADDEVVRTLVSSVHRDALPGFVLAHSTSPLAWAELADIAHSEGREVEAYAYATVAHRRGLELPEAAGWSDGDAVSWTDAPNQAVLRAAYALRRAAAAIGLVFEADALGEFLASADPDAVARIESEHTATQFITIIPPGATAPATMPPTESFVIRGED
ncbi:MULTISPECIES: DUF3151 family protein [unclassified Leifsonia]|uniref:DUF3151 family protein n=1 Tax=unclassified Leifsonia TaxID=2663824 RepID=UPI0007005D67|nr:MULTISPECIES: DUF3151 family protein [unclassified Leifsonia]KQX04953.1 hypothetical protein ASC59_11945 [Leifsonia sp. Root1293]KRA08585.1 hypothetical protein ASD61_11945 [Leifsonia sp. Root60]